jgi:hypothetical protein
MQPLSLTSLRKGVDYNNADGGRNAIFKIQGENKDWAKNVDTEHRNYDYLSMCIVTEDVISSLLTRVNSGRRYRSSSPGC